MVKLCELRIDAVNRLKNVKNDSPKADVDFLLSKLLGFTKTDIVLGEKELSDEAVKLFNEAVSRLEHGEPVQYIVGECEFMSLPFRIDSSTLVPRADTEILVEKVIELCDGERMNILEVGCGSGCIAVSLAHYMPEVKVFAIDISESALKITRKNAELIGVNERTHFFRHDIMKGFPELDEEIDILVSNPPYIPSEDIETLDIKVKGFEPKRALDGGEDGLDFYRKISEIAKIKSGGYLAFEVGFDQAKKVAEIMSERFLNIDITKDLSGTERVVTGQKK